MLLPKQSLLRLRVLNCRYEPLEVACSLLLLSVVACASMSTLLLVQPPQARSMFVWLLSPPPGEKSEDARAEPLICGDSTSPAFTSEVTPPSVRARAQGGGASSSQHQQSRELPVFSAEPASANTCSQSQVAQPPL
jgi:hypothetical protein